MLSLGLSGSVRRVLGRKPLDVCNGSVGQRVVGDVDDAVTVKMEWPAALVEFYDDEFVGLVRLAYLLVGSTAVAEEVVQDAFVACRERWGGIRSSPGGYVRSAVVNGARARTRRGWVEARHRPDPPPPDAPSELLELRDALSRLSWEQRTAIVLRFWVDLPDEQTAEVMGCAPGTVRSHISRGVAALRKELS